MPQHPVRDRVGRAHVPAHEEVERLGVTRLDPHYGGGLVRVGRLGRTLGDGPGPGPVPWLTARRPELGRGPGER